MRLHTPRTYVTGKRDAGSDAPAKNLSESRKPPHHCWCGGFFISSPLQQKHNELFMYFFLLLCISSFSATGLTTNSQPVEKAPRTAILGAFELPFVLIVHSLYHRAYRNTRNLIILSYRFILISVSSISSPTVIILELDWPPKCAIILSLLQPPIGTPRRKGGLF